MTKASQSHAMINVALGAMTEVPTALLDTRKNEEPPTGPHLGSSRPSSPLPEGDQLDVRVSNHAIRRLQQRFGKFRKWTRSQCECWIIEMVKRPDISVIRSTGEVFVRTSIGPRTLFLAVMPSETGTSCLVRTALSHAFAVNNPTRARRN